LTKFKFLTHLDLSFNKLKHLDKVLLTLQKLRFIQELNLQVGGRVFGGQRCCLRGSTFPRYCGPLVAYYTECGSHNVFNTMWSPHTLHLSHAAVWQLLSRGGGLHSFVLQRVCKLPSCAELGPRHDAARCAEAADICC
jgi:hypothetical protein